PQQGSGMSHTNSKDGSTTKTGTKTNIQARTCAFQVRGLSPGSQSKAADLKPGGLRYPSLLEKHGMEYDLRFA
ncbi:MAG: hypothetical protein ACRD3O_24190, partial [Terriglobia bacterium]